MNHMRRSFIVMLILGVMGAPSLGQAQPQAPDILKQVHEDTMLVVAIPSVKPFEQKLVAFVQAMGIPVPSTTPMMELLEEIGFGEGEGIDLNGGMALVMPTPEMGANDPPVVIMVKIADEAKLKANFEGLEAVEGQPGTFMYADEWDNEMYLKVHNGYAMLTNKLPRLQQMKPPTDANALFNRAGKLGGGAIAEGDIFVYLNSGKYGPMFAPMVAVGFNAAATEMDDMPDEVRRLVGGPDALKAYIRAFGTLTRSVMTQTDAVVVSGKFTDQGIMTHTAAQFKEGSAMAQALGQIPSADVNLDRLPADDFLVAFAMSNEGLPYDAVMTEINEQIVPNVPAGTPLGKATQAMIENLDSTGKYVTSLQAAYYAPDPAKNRGLSVAEVIETSDADAYRQSMRTTFTQFTAAGNDFMNIIVAESGGDMAPPMKLSFTTDARTIAGISVDQYKAEMSDEVKQEMNQGGMGIESAFGAMMMNQEQVFGTASDNRILLVNSQDDKLFEKLVAASDGSGKLTAVDSIAAARKLLPTDRFAEGYINASAVMSMFMQMQAEMQGAWGGQAPAVPPIPDMPPIAFSATSDSDGLAYTVALPREVFAGVGMAFMMQQQQQRQRIMAMQQDQWDQPVGPMDLEIEEGPQFDPAQDNASEDRHAATEAEEPGQLKNLSDNNHAAAIASDKPTVVVYWAPWSRNSKKQVDALDSASRQLGGRANFATASLNDAGDSAEAQGIEIVPTTIIYRSGEAVASKEGLMARKDLAEYIKQNTE